MDHSSRLQRYYQRIHAPDIALSLISKFLHGSRLTVVSLSRFQFSGDGIGSEEEFI